MQFMQEHNNVAVENRSEKWEEVPVNIDDDQFLESFGDLFASYLLMEHAGDQHLSPIDLFTTLYIAVSSQKFRMACLMTCKMMLTCLKCYCY